jgi:hypothetical protein
MQVAIENLNITLNQGQSSVARAFIEALLRTPDSPADGSAPSEPDAGTTTSQTAPPTIGEYWPGQGGIYAGVARGRDGAPDYHLVLCKEATDRDFTWRAALDHAKTIEADGHKDFTVPTRWESALLYANLQDQFDTDYWHWTSTQFSELRAWNQDFYYGYHYDDDKDYERRVRFVRRSSIL